MRGGNADVGKKKKTTRVWAFCSSPTAKPFSKPGWCVPSGEREAEKRGQESLGLIQKTVWLLGPGGGEREAKGRIVPQ